MDLASYIIGFLWGIAVCCIVYKIYKIYKNRQIMNILLHSISEEDMKVLFDFLDAEETDETENGDE